MNEKVPFGLAEKNTAGTDEPSGRKLKGTYVEQDRNERLGYPHTPADPDGRAETLAGPLAEGQVSWSH